MTVEKEQNKNNNVDLKKNNGMRRGQASICPINKFPHACLVWLSAPSF